MHLYHVPNSNSQRALWMLEELGQPYELTIMGDRASRLADPEHMARHPMGRVPVLEDGGTHIFESAAICVHLADSHPDAGLFAPPGSIERALVYQWAFFAMNEIQTAMSRTRLLRDLDQEAAGTAEQGLLEALGVVDRALEGSDYLVGNRFTVADLLVATAAGFVRRFEIALLPPNVARYLDRMDARPAKQRADARNP